MKSSNVIRSLAASVFVLISIFLCSSIVLAEGSRDLVENGGYRPYTQYSNFQLAGVKNTTILQVYAKAGETINLGSSVHSNVDKDIIVTDPNGNSTDYDVTTNDSNNGYIDTVTKETAGPLPNIDGYDPIVVPVSETGIYTVRFLGSGGEANSSIGVPTFQLADQPFANVQSTTVAAWDITVRDANGDDKTGRVFTKYVALITGDNIDDNTSTSVVNSQLYVLTQDGYIYKTSLNGMDPNGFLFFANSRGFVDLTDNSTLYHTITAANAPFNNVRGNVAVQSPEVPDTATNKTHYIFFNEPSADLPENMPTTPTPSLPATDQGFKGAQNVSDLAVVGTGGTFSFKTTKAISYQIIIDTNRDEVFDPLVDRVLANNALSGDNNIAWDGKDRLGTDVPVGEEYKAKIVLNYGEYHFPLIDVEYNPFGYKIEMLNAPGPFPAGKTKHTVYFDNSDYKTADGTLITLDAANPIFGVTTINGLAGVDSSNGANAFTGLYGDRKGIDTWTNFNSEAVFVTFDIVPSSYTVSFNSNGGTSVADQTVNFNESALEPIAPTKTGYTFVGWYTDELLTASYSFTSKVTSSFTLYAKWTPVQYSISFDGNGNTGGSPPATITEDYDKTIAIPGSNTLVKTGYSFASWNTLADGNGTTYAPNQNYTIGTSDVTMYAQWTINQYTVTFDGNGNTGGTAPADATDDFGKDVTIPGANTLQKEGHTFTGWNTDKDGNGDSYAENDLYTLGASNTTLYAQWVPNQYTISFDGNGNTDGTAPGDVNGDYNTDVLVPGPNTLAKKGHKFVGWNTQADGNGSQFLEGDTYTFEAKDVTMYAQWELEQFTVSFDGNGNTGGTAPASVTDDFGSSIEVPGPGNLVKTGYSFIGWNTQADGNGTTYDANDTYVMDDADVTMYAQWSKNQYTISFVGNGNTAGNAPATVTDDFGDIINVPGANTLVKKGHRFTGWNTAANGSGTSYSENDAYSIPAANVTMYAQWKANTYKISFDGNGNTAGVKPNDISDEYGKQITVPGPGTLVKKGYTFTGWNTQANGTGAAKAAGSKHVIDDQDVVLFAQWTVNPYTVSFNGNGNTGGVAPGTITEDFGKQITVPGPGTLAKTGYSFLGWNTQPNGNGTGYSQGSKYTVDDNNITMYAQWGLNKYTISFVGNGNTGGTAPASITDDFGKNITVPGRLSLVRKGYTFTGWNTSANGTGTSRLAGSTYMMPAQNVLMFAQWKINKYAVSFNGNGNTSGTAPATVTDDFGKQITVPTEGALRRTGHSFTGWNTVANGSGTAYTQGSLFTIDDRNTVMYAQWRVNQYTVTFVGNGNTGGVAPASVRDNFGRVINVPDKGTLTRVGYTFKGWNTAANGSGTPKLFGDTYTIGAANVTMHAQWEINKYNISFNSNGGTPVNPQIVDHNGKVTQPTGPTRNRYVFKGWFSDAELTRVYNFDAPVRGPITLHAKWELIPLTLDINGGNRVVVRTGLPLITGITNAPDGATVTLNVCGQTYQATVKDGKWSVQVNKAIPNGQCPVVAEIVDELGRKTIDRQTLIIDVPESLNHRAYMVGYPDGTYRPTRSVSRAEMAAALVRLIEQQAKRPELANKRINYTDIKRTNWHFSSVEAITNYGLMTGYPDGSFRPDQAITRKDIEAIVVKYVSLIEKRHGNYKRAMCSRCKTNFHLNELQKFLNKQQMLGAPTAFTKPAMTRAEIVTVMNRLFFRGPLTQKEFPIWKDVSKNYWALYEIQEASHNHLTIRNDNDRE